MTAFAHVLTVVLAVMATSAVAAESARQNADSDTDSGYLYFRDMGSATTLNPKSQGSLAPSLLETKQSARSVVAPLRSKGKAKTSERTFLFTPSGKLNDRKSLSVGVTTRTLNITDQEAEKTAAGIDVSGYNVGLSVGYRGFSVEAGYTRLDDARLRGTGSSSEGVDLGLSYRGNDWKTTLQVAGERYGDDKPVTALGLDKSYSVELGGAYLLTPRLSLTGGVKYQVVSPREELRIGEGDQASGSVYVGTNLKF